MMTDRQVRLLRQKRMEGKTQQTAAAVAGMSGVVTPISVAAWSNVMCSASKLFST